MSGEEQLQVLGGVCIQLEAHLDQMAKDIALGKVPPQRMQEFGSLLHDLGDLFLTHGVAHVVIDSPADIGDSGGS